MYQWGSYEMGLYLRMSPKSKPRSRDTLASARKKQANIRTIYSQHKKAAADLIANVEIGIFPSKEPVPQVRRWTDRQQRELDYAIGCLAKRSMVAKGARIHAAPKQLLARRRR